MEGLVLPLILLGVLMVFGAIFLIVTSSQNKKNSINEDNSGNKKNINRTKNANKDAIKKADIFDFMEFDRILDDMIVQENGTKFTMAIKCKGINYDLLSEVEKLSLEEGFTTFLNTLRHPIQLYVQAQNIDLKKTINMYNERIQSMQEQQADAAQEYNYVINNLESSDDDIRKSEYEQKSISNVLEYANDIVKYVERMSLNKNLLQRNFYVLVSYHSSEITSGETFTNEEIIDICYTELYTRVIGIISSLSACSVSGAVLSSNQLAELLYTSYNRDDANYLGVQQALDSGYYRLYSTSEDAFMKKRELLEERINEEAKIKAFEAIKQAIVDGTFVSEESAELEIEEEIARKAIDVVKTERVSELVKDKAEKLIKQEFKETKKSKINKTKVEVKEKLEEVKEEEVKVAAELNNIKEEMETITENPNVKNADELKQEEIQTNKPSAEVKVEEEVIAKEKSKIEFEEESSLRTATENDVSQELQEKEPVNLRDMQNEDSDEDELII